MTDEPSPISPTPQTRQRMRALLSAPIPRIFANGIGFQATATDVTIALLDNENPAGAVTVAYPVAKAIVVELTKLLDEYERRTGEKVKDIKELTALLNK